MACAINVTVPGACCKAAKKGSNARSASKELRKTVACDVYVIASHAGELTCLDLQYGTSTEVQKPRCSKTKQQKELRSLAARQIAHHARSSHARRCENTAGKPN